MAHVYVNRRYVAEISAHVFRCLEEPVLGCVGVGDGLLSGEGLGGDDKERRLGIKFLQRLRHVGAVDVGHKVSPQVSPGLVRLQRLCHHQGPEVRAADANVDDVGDVFAGVSLTNNSTRIFTMTVLCVTFNQGIL